MNKTIISCQRLNKSYHDGKIITSVLHDINLTVTAGEMLAIVGKSGSGKSTLLHLLGGLDQASSGQVDIMGENITKLSVNERGILRNQHLGFIYQLHHLLPEFTALENIMMPLMIRGLVKNDIRERANKMLKQIGLTSRSHHKPSALSGGERQRVAVARALITEPDCVLADEPTGNLDTNTADSLLELMLSMQQQLNTSFVIVTHDESIAKRMDRVLTLEDGKLV